MSIGKANPDCPRVIYGGERHGPEPSLETVAAFADSALRQERSAHAQTMFRHAAERVERSRRFWVQAVASIAAWSRS